MTNKTNKHSASPYNKRIELTARGRHGLCSFGWVNSLGKARAGFTLRSRPFRAATSGPCSQLIRALYGPKSRREKSENEIWNQGPIMLRQTKKETAPFL